MSSAAGGVLPPRQWVTAAIVSIALIVVLMVSYILYWKSLYPYSRSTTRIQWYPRPAGSKTKSTLAGRRVELLMASFIFGLNVASVGLTATFPTGLGCPNDSGPSLWHLETYHGLISGYYFLQIFFVPYMLKLTRAAETKKTATSEYNQTKYLLWACAILQLSATCVLGDLAFCVYDTAITVAFTFQIFAFLWTTLYDGYYYLGEIKKVAAHSSSSAAVAAANPVDTRAYLPVSQEESRGPSLIL